MTNAAYCEMLTRRTAQRFINKARSGKFALECLAEEYHELIWFCREAYGFCPNGTANLYDRLPAALREEILTQSRIAWGDI